MTSGASSPPWKRSLAASAVVDSASPGRNDVDSFSSASLNFVGSSPAIEPTIASSQTVATIHFALRPAALVRIDAIADFYRTDRPPTQVNRAAPAAPRAPK